MGRHSNGISVRDCGDTCQHSGFAREPSNDLWSHSFLFLSFFSFLFPFLSHCGPTLVCWDTFKQGDQINIPPSCSSIRHDMTRLSDHITCPEAYWRDSAAWTPKRHARHRWPHFRFELDEERKHVLNAFHGFKLDKRHYVRLQDSGGYRSKFSLMRSTSPRRTL